MRSGKPATDTVSEPWLLLSELSLEMAFVESTVAVKLAVVPGLAPLGTEVLQVPVRVEPAASEPVEFMVHVAVDEPLVTVVVKPAPVDAVPWLTTVMLQETAPPAA